MSSLSDFSDIPAEALLLPGIGDILTEPFACICNIAKFNHQLRIAHLIQAGHGAPEPTSTG